MNEISLNKRVTSIKIEGNKIIINLEENSYIPKEGEYFYVETRSGNEFLAIKQRGERITQHYCTYSIKNEFLFKGRWYICIDPDIKEIRPATKDEKALLNKALQKEGKKWNPETMRIENLPKVGDFCIFWDFGKGDMRCGILEEIDPTRECPYLINHSMHFKNCIPFESVKHFKEFIDAINNK